jgi:hypothetical protein
MYFIFQLISRNILIYVVLLGCSDDGNERCYEVKAVIQITRQTEEVKKYKTP